MIVGRAGEWRGVEGSGGEWRGVEGSGVERRIVGEEGKVFVWPAAFSKAHLEGFLFSVGYERDNGEGRRCV